MANIKDQCELDRIMPIHQLNKINEKGTKRDNFFPITTTQAVFDKSGIRLDAILSEFNHLFLTYQGTSEDTRLQVLSTQRRKGLVITYRDIENNTITEVYNSDSISDDNWKDSNNWVDFNDYITEIVKEQFNKNVTIIDNLNSTDAKAALSANQGRVLKELINSKIGIDYNIVSELPATGEKGIIYLVLNSTSTENNNIYDEYIWIEDSSKYEKLGSFTTNVDLSGYLPLTGGTLTGDIKVPNIIVGDTYTGGIVINGAGAAIGLYFSEHEYFHLNKDGITIAGKSDTDLLNAAGSTTPISDIATQVQAILVDGAPETLDTLNELAAALGDDPNFATTITTQLGNKVDKGELEKYLKLTGGTITGNVDINGALSVNAGSSEDIVAQTAGGDNRVTIGTLNDGGIIDISDSEGEDAIIIATNPNEGDKGINFLYSGDTYITVRNDKSANKYFATDGTVQDISTKFKTINGQSLIGSGDITIEGGGDYTLPTASADTLGGIKSGDFISVNADGTLTYGDKFDQAPSNGSYVFDLNKVNVTFGYQLVRDTATNKPEGEESTVCGLHTFLLSKRNTTAWYVQQILFCYDKDYFYTRWVRMSRNSDTGELTPSHFGDWIKIAGAGSTSGDIGHADYGVYGLVSGKDSPISAIENGIEFNSGIISVNPDAVCTTIPVYSGSAIQNDYVEGQLYWVNDSFMVCTKTSSGSVTNMDDFTQVSSDRVAHILYSGRGNNITFYRNNYTSAPSVLFTTNAGSTANRPTLTTNSDKGACYYDTDKNMPYWWDGTKWAGGNIYILTKASGTLTEEELNDLINAINARKTVVYADSFGVMIATEQYVETSQVRLQMLQQATTSVQGVTFTIDRSTRQVVFGTYNLLLEPKNGVTGQVLTKTNTGYAWQDTQNASDIIINKLTQDEYDELGSKDSNTLYIIQG